MTDETSPFNECSHAYLAGTRALLSHMRSVAGGQEAVRTLSRKVDLELLDNRASMIMCRFSEEPFYSDNVIFPRWDEVLTAGPALLCGGALLWTLAAFSIVRRRRHTMRDTI